MGRAPDELRATLDALPRIAWANEPAPVTVLDELAAELGLRWLGVKRDDRLDGLHGGTKVRKLDYLLATPELRDASRWASVGAIGSGHLVALAAAARELDRGLDAYLFWEPPSEHVLEQLAYVASGPARLVYHETRTRLALRRPSLVAGRRHRGVAVVPPGATDAAGTAGLVRAGLELAAQVEAGELPEPDRVYVALGSGGTAAGLAVGLALGGLRPTIHAVAAVERAFATRGRMRRLTDRVRDWLHARGIEGVARLELPPIRIEHGQLGRGYGVESDASRAACERLARWAVPLEGIYSGKAMAALLASGLRDERVLFWHTAQSAEPLPHDEAWRERLPAALRRRLRRGDRRFGRRKLVLAGAAAAAATGLGVRVGCYPSWPGWQGRRLGRWQAHVARAAADALLPPAPDDGRFERVAANVDAFLRTFPEGMVREVHAMFAAVEHGTPLGCEWRRFTELDRNERERYLSALAADGGMRRQIYRGLRDMVMLGYYQQPDTWSALGYGGPPVPEGGFDPDGYGAYARLVAEPDTAPDGWEAES